jgi:hypothetical protein
MLAAMPDIVRGTCHAILAYDIAFSVDLNEAERRIKDVKQRETIKHKRRAPQYFQYQPPPLRVTQEVESLSIGNFQTDPGVDVILYDFGGASVVYNIPLAGPLSSLLGLSHDLYENPILLEDSQRRVEQILAVIDGAVSKPSVSKFVEDYAIYQIEALDPPISISEIVAGHRQTLAQTLRAETRELSEDEVIDAMSRRISFGRDDLTVVDWNSAIVIDPEAEDIIAVLEFANVELMEMRNLDYRLDSALTLAYETLSKRPWRRFPFGSDPAQLQRVAQWQVDSAILFEGVNNALKLVGDQYLARLYRAATDRFHMVEWDATIIRKLETLDGIYGKISDLVTARRMELMEWIVIFLIAIEIVMPFFSRLFGH